MHNDKQNPQDNLRTATFKYNNQLIQNTISRNNSHNKENSTQKKNTIQNDSNESISLPVHSKHFTKYQSLTSINPPKRSLSSSQSPIKKDKT